MTMTIRIIPAEIQHLDTVAALLDQYRVSLGQKSHLPEARHFVFSRMTMAESVIFLGYETQSHGAKHEKPVAVGFAQLYPEFSTVDLKSLLVLRDLYLGSCQNQVNVLNALIQASIDLAKEREDMALRIILPEGSALSGEDLAPWPFQEDPVQRHYQLLLQDKRTGFLLCDRRSISF